MTLRTRSILVVEDEAVIRFDVADFLREHGYLVLEAANGDEALDVLRSDAVVHLVLSDIRMPGAVNGLDLARWITMRAPHIAVILVSGAETELDGSLSAVGEIELKPYDPEALLRRIRALLDT